MVRNLNTALISLTFLAGSAQAVLQGHEIPEHLKNPNPLQQKIISASLPSASHTVATETTDLSLTIAHYVRTVSWAAVAALTGWKAYTMPDKVTQVISKSRESEYIGWHSIGPSIIGSSYMHLAHYKEHLSKFTQVSGPHKLPNKEEFETIPSLKEFLQKQDVRSFRDAIYGPSKDLSTFSMYFAPDQVYINSESESHHLSFAKDPYNIRVEKDYHPIKLQLLALSGVSALLTAWSYKNPPAVEAGKVRTRMQKAVTAVSSGAELLGAAYLAIKQPELLGRSAPWAAASALVSQACINIRTWWLETHAGK